jgi:hypothetical protein
MDRPSQRIGVVLGIGLWLSGGMAADAPAQSPPDIAAPAWVSWEQRPGPGRRVVDQVCLVPDVPTFLEAIAAWDEGHAFPILIDDVELTFKFLRAFRPARIVRYPRRAGAIPADRLWDEAVAAVGRSWSGAAGPPDGDEVPRKLGPTPPGVVLSAPTSPMLAGGVALAAGRFQPLIRWDVTKHYGDLPTLDAAIELSRDLEARVADRIANYRKLGDDCDFLTLAGDYPYRYQDKDGPCAFDDLIGRSADLSATRWAYTGRLLGDPTASVYRAMCSLFLQPESTLMLNTYTDRGNPWIEYALARAASRLEPIAPVTLREGSEASLSDWARVFDPINRFGLVLINTHGSSTVFNLPGGPGQTGDIPPSVPTAVLMIHSFSATDPNDPRTLAGRWLANGAFVYFGAMNEPYLQSFRPPWMLAGQLAEGVPLGAANRRNPPDTFGKPWRLVYLGDPLYRLQLPAPRGPRLERWDPVDAWPAYGEPPQPDPGTPESTRLTWALKTALYRLQGTARPRQQIELPAVLGAIRRERLDARLRPVFDALLIDVLVQGDRADVLRDRLSRIPPTDRSPVVGRTLESLEMARLQKLVAARDFAGALALWGEVLPTGPDPAFLQACTDRVAGLADTPGRRGDWQARLLRARRGLDAQSPLAAIVMAELRRIDQPK